MSTVKYKCDTCKREIEVVEQRDGMTSYNKCIITKGCRGKLYKTLRNPYNVRGFLAEPNEPSLFNYFPRRAFFEYIQEIPNKVWKIRHGMGIFPAVVVYEVINGSRIRLDRDQYTVKLISDLEIEVSFPNSTTGVVHCVARSTKDLEPLSSPDETGLTQVTNDNILSLALLGKITDSVTETDSIFTCDRDDILINISIREPDREEVFCAENISSHDETLSPWIDWNALISRKRRNYCIKSADLKNFVSIQEFYNDISEIPDGTELRIISIKFGNPFETLRSRNLFALLADPPFNNSDKRRDILVDIAEVSASRINNSFIFIGGELYLPDDQIEGIYPPLERADPISQVPLLPPLSVQFLTVPFNATPCETNGSPCASSFQVEESDYQITGGSGSYQLFWSGSAFDITGANGTTPLISFTDNVGTYSNSGVLTVVDAVTGQIGNGVFTVVSTHL